MKKSNLISFDNLRMRHFASQTRGGRVFFVLPASGYIFEKYQLFIQALSQKGDVYVVEQGYFGLPMMQAIESYRQTVFFRSLAFFIRREFTNSQVTLVGSSVGAMHALAFSQHYEDLVESVIAISCPFCSRFANLFLLFWLNVALLSSPNVILGFFEYLGMLFSGPKHIVEIMRTVKERCGTRSILLCYKEIARFVRTGAKRIPTDGAKTPIFIMGRLDPVYASFGDHTFFAQHKTHFFDSGHAPFFEYPNEVAALIFRNS